MRRNETVRAKFTYEEKASMTSSFEELQKQVGAWHMATFKPEKINLRLKMKLREESREFIEAYTLEQQAEEAADCIIVLMAWAERNQKNLATEIEKKLEIVKNRNQARRDAERGISG